jgi:hypothetical protein
MSDDSNATVETSETTTTTTAAPCDDSAAPATDGAKRTYTSPRVNFGREALAMVADLAKAWDEDTSAASREDVLSVLAMVSADIESLMAGRPAKAAGEKRERSSSPNPHQGKSHYVGVLADGSIIAVECKKRPTTANVATVAPGVVSLFGPLRTAAGQAYRVSNKDIAGLNQVF